MEKMELALVVGCVLLHLTSGFERGPELLINPDFEEDMIDNWFVSNTQGFVSHSTDSHSGSRSAIVTGRSSPANALRQTIYLDSPGGAYFVSAYIKCLEGNNDHVMGHTAEISMTYTDSALGRTIKKQVAKVPRVWMSSGWVFIAGEFRIPADSEKIVLFFTVSDDASVEFLVDTASLQRFIEVPDIASELNQRIDQLRKGDLAITVMTPVSHDPSKVRVEVEQTEHAFPFGSATEAVPLFDQNNAAHEVYRDYFYKLFNWATIANSAKWRFMEASQGEPYFGTVDKALEALEAHNMSVRGHSISWGKNSKIMGWLKSKDVSGVKEAVSRRITYMAEHYKGRFAHWDVNNEDIHGTWYEESTQNMQFIEAMFTELHEKDPDAQLFLNDYEVLSIGTFTSAYKRMVMQLITNGVPIHAIGIQSHMSYYPDWVLMQSRLDQLAEAGIPLWITELDVRETDLDARAQGYDDALRLYFSHPSVDGIVLWGIWDQSVGEPTAMLINGADFVENVAGQRVRHLLTEEWHTSETLTPVSSEQTFSLRAFHGSYDVNVFYDGQQVRAHHVDLVKGEEQSLTVTLGEA